MRVHTNFSRWIAVTTLLLTACGGGDGPGNGGDAGAPLPALGVVASDVKTLQLTWPDAPGETGYRVLEQLEGSPVATEVASLPTNTTQHTLTVFLPERLHARYSVQACHAEGCTAHTGVAAVTPAVLNQAIGYFKAAAGTSFGQGVALSADGGTLAVSAPDDNSATGEPNDSSLSNSGAVHVFTRHSTGWVKQAVVKAAAPVSGDRLGRSLGLSADGQRMAVGSGNKVLVFERANGQWTEHAALPDPRPLLLLGFGFRLALSGDGNTLAVGAEGSFDRPGFVYVYARNAAGWQDIPVELMSDQYSDRYAHALALSHAGDTLLVGAPTSTASAPPATPGVVHVFTRTTGVWSRHTSLVATSEGDGDGFGTRVALSADGLTAAVGAQFEDGSALVVNGAQDNGRLNSGAAHVFVNSAGTWTQQAYIKAFNASEFDEFGHALALSGDGRTLAVGSRDEDGSGQGLGAEQDNSSARSGAVYLYRREGTVWRASQYVKAANAEARDEFGDNLALSGDGQTLAVSAPGEDSAAMGIGGDQADNSADGSGAVYLY